MGQPSIYLDSYLAPLSAFLGRRDVTDLYVNRPGELWIETIGGASERIELPALTETVLARLARQVAAHCAQGVNRENPLLAANLPDGSRIQICLPPATRGDIAIAIRKQVLTEVSLASLETTGAFDDTIVGTGADPARRQFAAGDYAQVPDLLAAAVRQRMTVLVSGGASTGKTTLLNALLDEIPPLERLVLIEDTPELRLRHANAVGLVAARGGMGEARVTPEDLLIASLRMRPDRIILGEVRGSEAMTFLRAANSGHPGSLCTIHADSPERALDQMALLVLQTGPRMNWEDITQYVRRSVDLVVQLERRGGMRLVASVVVL